MKKIKNYILNFLYALPFGLKSGNEQLNGSTNSQTGNDTTINQQVEDKTVAKHLLKGEITEAVEELRYRTYKVDEESQNYDYLGNGVAIKRENNNRSKSHFKFTQRNRILVSGVLDELERVGQYGKDNYALEIMYKQFTRFRLEEFVDRIIVDANTKTEDFLITLVFTTIPNPYNVNSKAFINELKKLQEINLNSEYAVSHNDILSNISTIAFSTYKADGEDNFTNYAFLGTYKLQQVQFSNNECLITYKWSDMLRVPLDKLSHKYNSQTMKNKYDLKEVKNVDVTLEEFKEVQYCQICGKTFTNSKYPHICDECYKKMMQK